MKKKKLKKNKQISIPQKYHEKVLEKVRNKNEEYKDLLNCDIEVLKFEDSLLKAQDYFGFLKVGDELIISEGDYLSEYKEKKVFINKEDVSYIKNKVNEEKRELKYDKSHLKMVHII